MLLFYTSMIENDEDKKKFERLYKNYKFLMLYTAKQVLKVDPYLAEDAVHLAFMRVMNNLHKIDEQDESRTKSFLSIITRNVAIGVYKRTYGKQDNKKDIPLEDIDDLSSIYHEKSVESVVLENVRYEELVKMIKTLPDKYADVILLKYSQGLSDSKIAELLDITPSAVRKRSQRAREKLACILELAKEESK